MRWNDPWRTLLFGAVAAAAWPAVRIGLAPWMGPGPALQVFAAVAIAAYVVGLAPRLGVGLKAAFGTLVACVVAAGALPGLWPSILGMGAVLAVVRSAVLHRSKPLRALLLELVLVGGGLRLAGWLAVSSSFGVALATWAFFLVQGAYFLFGGVDEARPMPAGRDAFEEARARLERALGES